MTPLQWLNHVTGPTPPRDGSWKVFAAIAVLVSCCVLAYVLP